jgi:hypothetical protein
MANRFTIQNSNVAYEYKSAIHKLYALRLQHFHKFNTFPPKLQSEKVKYVGGDCTLFSGGSADEVRASRQNLLTEIFKKYRPNHVR